jgi:hypothetical protein
MTDICTCNFSHYGVMLDSMPDEENPHKPTCPFGEPIFHHMDTTDWTPEDHWENSIDGFWCPHAEEAKDHYADGCSICDKED